MSPEMIFLGIDTTGAGKPFTYAALDMDGHLLALNSCELDDLLAFIDDHPSVCAAINAPACPNQGLVKKRLGGVDSSPGTLRGVDMRLAEYELRQRGIHVSATPGRVTYCPAWLQLGISLYQSLTKIGFRRYPDAGKAARLMLETHPHAVFCVLIGKQPLPKPTLEGRLQRQLILHDRGLDIHDPLDFFEEITRYKLMRGILPMEFIYTPDELDALAAAYTACLAATQPAEVMGVGDKSEGQIVLPVKELKDSYE
jgi:hypothetical protein